LVANQAGTIGGKCYELKIDPSTEDYIISMEIQTDKEQVKYLKFIAFSGKALEVGIPDVSNRKIVNKYTKLEQLVAFNGFAS